MKTNMTTQTLYRGKHLEFKSINGWEYVERTKVSGIVAILAITDDQKLLMVEQLRPPVGKNVIEIPAGLAGDIPGSELEALAEAAKRELLEETGYEAAKMEYLTEGPVSAGLSTEILTFFKATGLRKVEKGGGDGTENIQVHEILLGDLQKWLAEKQKSGVLIDCKIFAGLWLAENL